MEASESLRGSRSESLRTVVLEQGSDDVPAQKVEDDVDAQKASPALEDSENPQLWSDAKKIRNNCIIGIGTLSLTYSSSAMAPSLAGIVKHYHVSQEAAILTISLFVLGFGLGPFLAGPSSDVFGRRNVYIVTFASFTAWSWGAAFAPNFAALALFRFFAGMSGSSALNNHPASISDFVSRRMANRYTSLYAFCAFEGAAIAPLIGGFIVARTSWRWNMIVTAIFVTISFILLVVGTDETCKPVLLARKNQNLSTPDGPSLAARYKKAIILPFTLLFTQPVVAVTAVYLSLVYGLLYGFFAVFPIIYVEIRGWSEEGLALSYIALAVGFVVGGLILRFGQDWAYERAGQNLPAGKNPPPDARFAMLFWFGWTVPVGIFLIAFCSYKQTHWFGDTLGMFLFAIGTLVVFTGLIPFIIDLYLSQAASALAALTATRAIMACGFPLFSSQMYHKLGIPGASCLLAGIAILLTPLPWIFRHYGKSLWGDRL